MQQLTYLLKDSWQPRLLVAMILLIHYLPYKWLPAHVALMALIIYWFIHKLTRQPSIPTSLHEILHIISKDHHTSLTINMRLSQNHVFEFDTASYIYCNDQYDIRYQGYGKHRLLELGPRALTQQSHSLSFFVLLLQAIPLSRFQQLIISVNQQILSTDMPIEFLSPFFQSLKNRYRRIPYDIFVHGSLALPKGKKNIIHDLKHLQHSTQYCQLLKEHIESTINQISTEPHAKTHHDILDWHHIIEPLQSLVQKVQIHKTFVLKHLLITRQTISWSNHLPEANSPLNKAVLWNYVLLSTLIGCVLWQWSQSVKTHQQLSSSISQQQSQLQQKRQTMKPNYSIEKLLQHARHYAHLSVATDKNANEAFWPKSTVIDQLNFRSEEEILQKLDNLYPKPDILKINKFSEFEMHEKQFKDWATDYCLWQIWPQEPDLLSQCIENKTAHTEQKWLKKSLDLLLTRLLPDSLNSAHSERIKAAIETWLEQKSPSTPIHQHLPMLIHIASKHKSQEELTRISQLSEILSHIENSRTWAQLQHLKAALDNDKIQLELPKAMNTIDETMSNQVATRQEFFHTKLVWEAVNTSWKKDVLPKYQQIKACYPFNLKSTIDCSETLLRDFFRVNGTLDMFIKDHLEAHINQGENGISWHDPPTHAPAHLLEQIMLAKIIQKTLFNPQGKVQLQVRIRPKLLPNGTKLKLQSGSEVHDIQAGRPHEINWYWQPYAGQPLMVTAGSAATEKYDSPWGLYRWVQAHIHDDQNDLLTLSVYADKQQLLLQLLHATPLNMWHPQTLSSFELPALISEEEGSVL